jgi:NTP pyrophosphatase (non-canonical NTP hydrolase)
MNEEVGEIAHELTRGNLKTVEMKDALGDTAVTLIILADILGFDIVRCLEIAYDEIKNRKGQTKDGSFVKEENGEN